MSDDGEPPLSPTKKEPFGCAVSIDDSEGEDSDDSKTVTQKMDDTALGSTQNVGVRHVLSRTMTACGGRLRQQIRQSLRVDGTLNFGDIRKEYTNTTADDEEPPPIGGRMDESRGRLSLRTSTATPMDRCGSSTSSVLSSQYPAESIEETYVGLMSEDLPTTLDEAVDKIKEQDVALFEQGLHVQKCAEQAMALLQKLNKEKKTSYSLFELCAKMETEIAERTETWEERVKEKEKENYVLVEELKKTKQQLNTYQLSLRYMEADKGQATEEAEELKRALEDKKEAEKEAQNKQNVMWATEKMQIFMAGQRRDKEIKSLKESAGKAEAELATVKAAMEEATAAHETEAEELLSKQAKLLKEVDTLEKAGNELRVATEQEAAHIKQRHEAELASRDSIVVSVKASKAETDDLYKRVVEELSQRDDAIAQLKSALSDKDRVAELKDRSVQDAEQEWQEKVRGLSNTIEKTKEAAKMEAKVLGERVEEKDRLLSGLNQDLLELKTRTEAEIMQLKDQVAAKENEKVSLEKRLKDESDKMLDGKLAEAQRRHEELVKRHEAATAKNTEHQAREVQLSEELDSKAEKIFQQQSAIEAHLGRIEELTESLKVTTEQHAQVKERLEAEAVEKERDAARHESLLGTLRSEHDAARAQLLALKDSSATAQQDLQAKVSNLRSALDAADITMTRHRNEAAHQAEIFDRTLAKRAEELRAAQVRLAALEQAAGEKDAAEKRLQAETRALRDAAGEAERAAEEAAAQLRAEAAQVGERLAEARGQLEGGRERHQSEVDELRRLLAEEKKGSSEAEARLGAAAEKWKAAAEEARTGGETRLRDVRVAFARRLDEAGARLAEARSELAEEQAGAGVLRRDLEAARADGKGKEAEVAGRLTAEHEEEKRRLAAHYGSLSQDASSQLMADSEGLSLEVKQERQRSGELRHKLAEAEERGKREVSALRDEVRRQAEAAAEELQEERKRLGAALERQARKTKEELERSAELEAKLEKARTAFRKREEELKEAARAAADSAAENVRWTAERMDAEISDHKLLADQTTKTQESLHAAILSGASQEKLHLDAIASVESKLAAATMEASQAQALVDTLRREIVELNSNLTASHEKALQLESEGAKRVDLLEGRLQDCRERYEQKKLLLTFLAHFPDFHPPHFHAPHREVRLEMQVEQLAQVNQEAQLQVQRARQSATDATEELTGTAEL